MTCIVALKHKGNVYMGSDSACTSGGMIQTLSDSKSFIRDGLIIGATGYVRPMQILQHAYKWPMLTPNADVEDWLYNEFIPGWQECLKHHKQLEILNEQASQDSSFLIGVRGRIFEMHNYFEVIETVDEYLAVGCGCEVACGSLYTTGLARPKLKPNARILTALNAASYHLEGVRPPFHIGYV